MNDFKVTLWLHTSMSQDELIASIEEMLPQAAYSVEDQSGLGEPTRTAGPKKVRTVNLGPGMEDVEVRDHL